MPSAGPGFDRLSAAQRALVGEWMPAAEVVADLSWNLVDTVVLRVRHDGDEFVVKAAGPDGHHFARELDAHLGGLLSVWADGGNAPVMRHHDRDARVLVTQWLPGELAYRTPWGVDPAVHRRAGALLRVLHAQAARPSDGVDAAASARSLVWLDSPHAIVPDVEARLRAALAALGPWEADLVPTHGDWQPRNWLVDPAASDEVRVIDFGRFAFRPAASDFVRLAVQEWRENPACEAAFLDGYGDDPRHPDHWLLMRMREAIGTACWAHQVGDEAFEAQGHRMIADALAEFDAR
ncbi:phosphotransferase [Microbacterium sp. NEAU-LLC]|uniref:Phosphotransferase n=1 Tax=Microbacterium helvum TaxID=2773713 RepID=A0ABR8NRX7_9MICO|nr:phosphotransferase [Microbacterium helvum]MBD3943396.1 phosphotransferase [Microbacterium helvum]